MPGQPRLVYWDSSVFLSYINAYAERILVLENLLAEIQKSNGSRIIVTSAIAKVEVAFSQMEGRRHRLSDDEERRIDLLWNDESVIRLIEFHDGIAVRARQLMREALTREWSLKPPDAIHLASAESVGVEEIHTYDPKWPRYHEIIGLKICEPYTEQLSLPLE